MVWFATLTHTYLEKLKDYFDMVEMNLNLVLTQELYLRIRAGHQMEIAPYVIPARFIIVDSAISLMVFPNHCPGAF